MPTLAGFILFIRGVMGITTAQLPDNSTYITDAYTLAQEIVSPDIGLVSPVSFKLATYNLGGDYLINYTPDQSGQTVFADARKKYNTYGFVGGVIQSTGDEGTSESMAMADFIKNLSMSDLQNLKTPYGRTYMAIAMRFGSLWGIS